MKKNTIVAVVLALAFLMGVMAPSVRAECVNQGIVIHTSNYATDTFVYMRPVSTTFTPDTYLIYFVTSEDKFIDLATQALQRGSSVEIKGDAATGCEDTGVLRGGGRIFKVRIW